MHIFQSLFLVNLVLIEIFDESKYTTNRLFRQNDLALDQGDLRVIRCSIIACKSSNAPFFLITKLQSEIFDSKTNHSVKHSHRAELVIEFLQCFVEGIFRIVLYRSWITRDNKRYQKEKPKKHILSLVLRRLMVFYTVQMHFKHLIKCITE